MRYTARTGSRFMRAASLVAALALTAAACGGGDAADTATDTDDEAAADENGGESRFVVNEPVTIGYSVFDLQQPYWQAYSDGIEDAADERGWGFVRSDQNSEQQQQVSGSADLIAQDISALIVSPVQPEALPATVDAAHEAQIPIIIGDVGAEGDYDAFVLSDNYEGGVIAAQYVVEQLSDVEGTKEVGVITLHPGNEVGIQRANGFRDEMENHDDFEIVAELSGEDTVEGGFQVAQDMLSANPEIQAIYAGNDPEAIGASQALEQAGLNGVDDVLLVGFNGDPPALELIEEGKMAATIAQDPYGQGQRAVELAETLMEGGTIEYDDEEERAIFFPVDLVTAENVAEYR